ncbi:RING finger protein 228-like [Genypterus blacodes]|uniref:RING finger protein 228-like n=1 Tax=Genypterus blacodes TaxID=154954 RepID=UPI003F7651E9
MAEEVKTGGDCVTDLCVSFPGEEYECKICFNYFDMESHVPKMLQCSHTFCQECLDSLHVREGRGWRIGCPLCRHRTPVPEYRVYNLPDNTAVTEAMTEKRIRLRVADTGGQATPGPGGSAVTPQESHDSLQTCKQFAFTTGCVCAIFSFISMLVLLFLGLIFVHNFNTTHSAVGPLCLFGASVLALCSLILTWLMCLVKYRPETEAGQGQVNQSIDQIETHGGA